MIRLRPETTIWHGGRYEELGTVEIQVPALDFVAAITADSPTAETLGYDPETADGTRIWHDYAARAIEAGELAKSPVTSRGDMKIQAWLHAAVARQLQLQDI